MKGPFPSIFAFCFISPCTPDLGLRYLWVPRSYFVCNRCSVNAHKRQADSKAHSWTARHTADSKAHSWAARHTAGQLHASQSSCGLQHPVCSTASDSLDIQKFWNILVLPGFTQDIYSCLEWAQCPGHRQTVGSCLASSMACLVPGASKLRLETQTSAKMTSPGASVQGGMVLPTKPTID